MRLINKKNIYMLTLAVICLLMIVIVPTYAKFPSSYVTGDDIVGLSLDFDLAISNIEEYEEVVVPAGESLAFNVEVTNSTGADAYYGIWYKMAEPVNITSDISIGRLFGTTTSTSGFVVDNGMISVAIGIINNSSNTIKVNIGVGSSATSTSDIEYLGGKSLVTGEVEVVIGNLSNYSTLAQHVENLYNDGSILTTVNIDNEVKLNTNQNIMLDDNGEYRYYGANPNNYVSFNGELWRIISVVEVLENENDSTWEYRTKLIRAEDIGSYAWDSGDATVNDGYGVNDWTQADLMTELNNLYYNQQSGTCYSSTSNTSIACNFASIGLNSTSRNMIDNTLWYIDAINYKEYNSYSAADFYSAERAAGATWTGKVGLMYPSDYGYATDWNLCTNLNPNMWDDNDGCTNNNWLLPNYSENSGDLNWTISPNSYDDYAVTAVDLYGGVTWEYTSSGSLKEYVFPVVYLKSNVVVTGGSGTSGNPYRIALRASTSSVNVNQTCTEAASGEDEVLQFTPDLTDSTVERYFASYYEFDKATGQYVLSDDIVSNYSMSYYDNFFASHPYVCIDNDGAAGDSQKKTCSKMFEIIDCDVCDGTEYTGILYTSTCS